MANIIYASVTPSSVVDVAFGAFVQIHRYGYSENETPPPVMWGF